MKTLSLLTPLLTTLAAIAISASTAAAQSGSEVCIYQDERGRFHQVASKRQVPARFRKKSRCQATALAAPEEITLKGNVRREVVSSPLGPIELRWPRKVEMLFGRNPLRATVEAARVVSKVLRQSSFPPELQRMNVRWKIVFMDENLPEAQIPMRLISNCHPGWMTPPANIYIVAQRIAQGCSSNSRSASVADSTLAKVMIHEIGHAVEYHLLKEQFGTDRMRAEGFATWFARYASGYSSMIRQREVKKEEFERAKQHLQMSPGRFVFDGSPFAYARASLYQEAVVKRYGISGLMRVYQRIRSDNLGFIPAVKKVFGWNQNRLEKEITTLVK